ncbi:MAG: hypothetical protein R3B72_26535 [Polyangiaceae bacterium]
MAMTKWWGGLSVIGLMAVGAVHGGCGADTGKTATGAGGSGAAGLGGGPASSSVGTGGTGGAGGTASGAGGDFETTWQGEVPDLVNDAVCAMPGQIGPASAEIGHWYAVRLTPPSYPYTVNEIVYELGGSNTCDTTAAHDVAVWVEGGAAPADTPANMQVLSTPATMANEQVRVVTHALPSPVTLASGEHLFVAVELAAQPLCVMVCYGATESDRDYWSNSVMPPYPWSTLGSSNLDVHARVGANGG